MTKNQLKQKILKDLDTLGICTDFSLELRGYSKSYYGRYYIEARNIVMYPFLDETETKFMPYSELFTKVVHEAIHHYQWTKDPTFTRVKGVMHNEDFWFLYNKFIDKAKRLNII